MNQRIQELAVQSGLAEAADVRAGFIYPSGMEKFVELLIRECAAYLNGAMEVHNQREQDLCDLAARKIKEHFGVE